ncbi:hypothetical protein C8J57DRAFT_1464417 [Mycena rebaudengoi]|nr:hypothetical protein C8J57DRAFT_1464417 [Mycena rebaudengoi]
MGPEEMGGRGDTKARAEAEAQRTGKDVVEIGELLPFGMPMYPLISGAQQSASVCLLPRYSADSCILKTLMMADGPILGTLNAYDQEAINALDHISSTVSPRDGDIKAFLDTMLAEYGPRSTLLVLISFGTVFWPMPTVQEHLEELVHTLTEKKFPFILSYASPFAVVSPELSAKVKASGLGMLTPWCPQKFILNYAATDLFMTHGGHGGVSESLASRIPLICWPFEGDQPEAALHLAHNLNVAFHLIEIRTGKGQLTLFRESATKNSHCCWGRLPRVRDESVKRAERGLFEGHKRHGGDTLCFPSTTTISLIAMARVASETKTKTATKTANTKTKAKTNADGTEKTKRAPTAYNLFVSKEIKLWREDNPDKPYKEGMSAVALLWADSPENPNRGKPVVKRAPKTPKEPKEKAMKSKPKAKSKKAVDVEEEEDDEEEKENEIVTSDD